MQTKFVDTLKLANMEYSEKGKVPKKGKGNMLCMTAQCARPLKEHVSNIEQSQFFECCLISSFVSF